MPPRLRWNRRAEFILAEKPLNVAVLNSQDGCLALEQALHDTSKDAGFGGPSEPFMLALATAHSEGPMYYTGDNGDNGSHRTFGVPRSSRFPARPP